MLPAAPKTLGRLSDVFVSALGAVTGHSNRLGFKRTKKAIVILVDGLGSENIRRAAGHAPFLNAALAKSKSINSVFPSTTAAAITSFGVGARPSDHGVLGYSVFERKTQMVRNLLSGWGADFKPENFQPLESISADAKRQGIRSVTIGPGEYAGSGFTKLNMSDAEYLAAKTFEDRASATLSVARAKQSSLTYVYFPELDGAAHQFGADSVQWLNLIEELDLLVRNLVAELPDDVGLLLTADHGIVDVPRDRQIMLDELEIEGLIAVTGDPRNSFLYFEPGTNIPVIQAALALELDGDCYVATPQDLIEQGWLGNNVRNDEYLPDLFVISRTDVACYHRQFAKPQSLRMIGQHGSISGAELSVPLLKFCAFAD